MLRAAITFFVIGLVAMLLGANNVAGVSIELGRTLLIVFIALAVISFVASLLLGRKAGSGLLGVLIASAVAAGFIIPQVTMADDTATKAADKAGDAKTDVSKSFRTAKRQVRKGTGNDSASKDLQDKGNDASDDLKNAGNKVKRRVQ